MFVLSPCFSAVLNKQKKDLINTLEKSSMGFYGNVGMLREANILGVVDVPELYYSNPIIKSYSDDSCSGAWVIEENANYKKLKAKRPGLENFLYKHGLSYTDTKNKNVINKIFVDLGLILSTRKTQFSDDIMNYIYQKFVNSCSV